jgi:hypothetical protein
MPHVQICICPLYAVFQASMLSFGLAIMFATLKPYNSACIMEGAPYMYRNCIWHSCLAC